MEGNFVVSPDFLKVFFLDLKVFLVARPISVVKFCEAVFRCFFSIDIRLSFSLVSASLRLVSLVASLLPLDVIFLSRGLVSQIFAFVMPIDESTYAPARSLVLAPTSGTIILDKVDFQQLAAFFFRVVIVGVLARSFRGRQLSTT